MARQAGAADASVGRCTTVASVGLPTPVAANRWLRRWLIARANASEVNPRSPNRFAPASWMTVATADPGSSIRTSHVRRSSRHRGPPRCSADWIALSSGSDASSRLVACRIVRLTVKGVP